jgi:mutator family transposase
VVVFYGRDRPTSQGCQSLLERLAQRGGDHGVRADVVGIFPNEESIVRLIGAVLLEANDDWQLQHRYMQIEGMAELNTGLSDDHLLEATPRAA